MFINQRTLKKIYNQKFLDPNKLSEINNCFIENKDIISDFVYENPYNFSEEELKIVEGFKTALSGETFIVCGFDRNYTHIYSNTNKKIYMVKGIRANLDEILNNHELPFFVSTTLLNFKNTIIYNGMISTMPLLSGSHFKNLIFIEVSQAKKCYTIL